MNEEMILKDLREKLWKAEFMLMTAIERDESDQDIQDAECVYESAAADLAKAEHDFA